jgi:polyhydroxyalkanoate synthase
MTIPTKDADEATSGGEVAGLPSVAEAARALAGVLGQGRTIARESARLVIELGRVAVGGSELAPARGDRRFADPAWSTNPLLQRVGLGYLAAARALTAVVDSFEASSTDARRVEQARFASTVITSALAPTNFFPTNPAAVKRAYDTGGRSVLRGVRNWAGDLRHNGGMPSIVPRDAFTVGADLAVSPGWVLARDDVAELLQYRPSTETVHARPLLVVPPPMGRYYFLDLRPGRSFVEYAVGAGLQTFLLSWRNPTAKEADWDLDTYAARVSRAIDEVRAATGSEDVNVIGFCAGGIITTCLLNHLAASGDRRVHSMSYAVTLLDFGRRAPISAFNGHGLLSLVQRRSRRAGIVTSRQMGSAFTWMRPDDLVFNYWVNNYLMGEDPPAFDILAWNADGTNLPGALHVQFLDIFRDNSLVRPGELTVLGTPLDLGRISLPLFVTGAVTDHLTPWKGCFRTTQLLAGDATFVLSWSGHIASLVNPPGNPKAHYWVGGPPGEDPDRWLAEATKVPGSWWEAWSDWVRPHSGDVRPASAEHGAALEAAPGRYVRDLPLP